jgi:sulfatase modifying factor 1
MRRQSILVLTALLFSAGLCLAACPSADLTGDCFVDYEDFALMAAQWLTTDPCIPDDMAYIPDGTFEMGDNLGDGYSDELPVHTVTVDSFYMGKYEVTNGQYCDYLNSALGQGLITVTNGRVYQAGSGTDYLYCDTNSGSGYSQIDYNDVSGTFNVRTKSERDMSNDPMVMVTWYGAVAYCNWRSQQGGKEQCYNLSTWNCDFSKKGYRLATEAEWEYAARGRLSGRRFPWGDTISHSQANYYSSSSYSYDISPTRGYHPTWDDVYPYTSPGGTFAANGYGLYDMAGNVWEWCNDWYSTSYYRSSPTSNPTGPISGSYRVLRGGSWDDHASYCRVALRLSYGFPDSRRYFYGFRIVLDF